MKLLMGNRKQSIFKKVLLLFMAVITPIYLFNIEINIFSQNRLREKIVESFSSKIEFLLDNLEAQFYNIMSAQRRMINDNELVYLAVAPQTYSNYRKLYTILAIQKKLIELRSISNYIEDASIYMPLINKKITHERIFDFNEDEFNIMQSSSGEIGNLYHYWNNDIFINFAPDYLKVYYNNKKIPAFIVSVQISREKLQNVLEEFSGWKGGGALLLGKTNGVDIIPTEGIPADIIPILRNKLSDNVDKEVKIEKTHIHRQNLILAYKYSNLLKSTLCIYVPEEMFWQVLSTHRISLWIVTILTGILVFMFSLWFQKLVLQPLKILTNGFQMVQEGKLDISLNSQKNDEFKDLYESFNQMVQRLKLLIERVYEQKIYAQRAELKQLQYQINPHFLYNSFFLIYRLAKKGDNELIIKLTEYLGRYYQFITQDHSDTITLSEEVTHAMNYANIQCIRFSNRIKVEFEDIPESYKNIKVPRLIIQPLVENAFEHGMKRKLENGIIKMQIKHDTDFLRIIVEDNGDVEPPVIHALQEQINNAKKGYESVGLINIHKRLQIMYGEESGVYISRSTMGGLKAELRIPLCKLFKED